MRITSHPLRGSAATKAVRNSKAFDPAARVHLRFVELDDASFMAELSPGPSPASRRSWIANYKLIEAQGSEFNLVVVEYGRARGLVRMHEFITIGDETSFRWGDFVSLQPGLLPATALSIYSLGFDALGFARAHMVEPYANRDMTIFHLETGAALESDDGAHRQFRFGAEDYDQVRAKALEHRAATAPV